jgi:hypothetical protein
MGEAEQLACAVPRHRDLAGFRLSEPDQRRLRWMNTQAKAAKLLGPYAHELLRLRFQRAPDDQVIRKAGQAAAALEPGTCLALEPFIQPLMEDYIGQGG